MTTIRRTIRAIKRRYRLYKTTTGKDNAMNLDETFRQTAAKTAGTSMSPADIKLALACLDLTSLNDNDTPEAIATLCANASQGTLGHVAAVCVYPQFVAQAAQALADKHIGVATVINFPTGKGTAEETARATSQAIADGATEIDIVLDHESFRGDKALHAANLLLACREACGEDVKMKVILESAVFPDMANIYLAGTLAIQCGADILKTSTGKHQAGGASLPAAFAMMQAIKNKEDSVRRPIGLKLSGGLRTVADCAPYFAMARDLMGKNWIRPENFRIGASSLLSDLVTRLNPPKEQVVPPKNDAAKTAAPSPENY